MRSIDVGHARARLHSGIEIGLIDVREHGQYGEGHPLFAVNCPYSQLELRIGRLVPRLSAHLILIDDGDGVAERAAGRLGQLGYSHVETIAGGMPAWREADFPVYKGVNVPTKTLGEMAEHIWHPQMVTAGELAEWRSSGKRFRLFDARPPAEYAKMRVPGAICLPNGESAHRLPGMGSAGEPTVITCAGRTRGIIGAIGLKLSGFEGPVFALENGTQGWALADESLERDNPRPAFSAIGEADEQAMGERARAFMNRFDLPMIDAGGIDALCARDDATTYVFDVRSEEEATADPIAIAEHALSGQLVQAADQWVGVRRSTLVFCDTSGMRAALAAFWLRQIGYEVYVALIDDDVRALPGRNLGFDAVEHAYPTISGETALERLTGGRAILLDLRPSMAFRKAHVDSATWTIRPRLEGAVQQAGGGDILLVAGEPGIAELAAADIASLTGRAVAVIEGGHDALVEAGASVVSSADEPADREAIDFLFFVHDRHEDNKEASRRYLAWELGLVAQLDDLERGEFKLAQP